MRQLIIITITTSIQFIEPKFLNGSILMPKSPIPLKFNITSQTQKMRQNIRRLVQYCLFTRISQKNIKVQKYILTIKKQKNCPNLLYDKNSRNLQTYQDLYSLETSPFSQDLLCIGKNTNGEWDVVAGNCKSYIEIDATGALYVTCKCEQLTITTVTDFISDIINIEKFSKAFTIEAVIALFSFPFYKSIIIYALLFMTIGLIISLSYGFRQDLIDVEEKALHEHFVESEYIRITALEKFKQKQKEKQEDYASRKQQPIDPEDHVSQEMENQNHQLSEEEDHIKNQFLLISLKISSTTTPRS